MLKKVISLFSLLVLLNSCIGFHSAKFKERNPTFYVFQMSLDLLRDLIIRDFEKDKSKSIEDMMSIQDISYRRWDILTIDDEISKWERYKHIFGEEENKKDLYLRILSNPIVSYSKLYYKYCKQLQYTAEFQLHFVYIDEKRTKIEINTFQSQVLYFGLQLGSHAIVKFKKVAPTTIEEYEILLRIGKLIGENNMPPLKVPQ